MKNTNAIFFSLLFLLAISSCGNGSNTNQVVGQEENRESSQAFKVDTISTDLNSIWGMAFLPDGRILLNEKEGVIRIVQDGKLLEERVENVPEVFYQGQGGLLDIQLHPQYEENGWIYLSYSKAVGNGAITALTRARLDGNKLVDVEEIFLTEPVVRSSHHFGSRIAFDNDGYLYITVGERGTKENAQDLSNHYGKVHRLHDDGRIPEDNPFAGDANAKGSIWTYGNRNMQGLYYDKDTGILWEHEHGPKGGDELNIIEKGKNYGWPVITYGVDYDNSIISDITEKEGMEQPVHYWVPSIAVCGLTMVKGDMFPGWEGNLLVGALAQKHVARLKLDGTKVVEEERLLQDVARVRSVAQSPDGYIYVGTEGPGMLLRLSPQE
jgi:glucose/arabinose dehydrogenase